MKKYILLMTLFLIGMIFSAACGGLGSSGPGKLTLKYPGTDKLEMEVKSGGFYASTKTWSRPGQSAISASYFICMADYDIDMSQGAKSIGEPVTAEGGHKVCLSIDGAEGTDDKTAFAIGTYPAAKRGEGFAFFSVSTATIRTFKEGKEVKDFLNVSKTEGEVKISSATADSITGEVNLSDGDNEIKGKFTAQGFKR